MLTYPTEIYRQAIVVLESNSEPPAAYPRAVPIPNSSGNYAYTKQMITNVPETATAGSQTQSVLLRTTFSSVPVIWKSELMREYQELGNALSEMNELEEGDEWKIDAAVYVAACYVAAGLMANSFPAPRVFTHGRKSVVFNWSKETDNLYLTVSADRASALVSSPERIERRVEWSTAELADPSTALSSIKAVCSADPLRLLTGTVPDPHEIVG